MDKVTIYQFVAYDVHSDTMKKSRRWGVRDAIEKIARGVVMGDGIEVDKSTVEAPCSDVIGLTAIDFNPLPRKLFKIK